MGTEPSVLLLVSGLLMVLVGGAPAVWWRLRSRTPWRWFWAGAAIWTVGVALKFAFAAFFYDSGLTAMESALPPWAYLGLGSLYGGVLTGVFEDGVTLAAGLIWARLARDWRRAMAVGLGAGGLEAILLGLVTYLGAVHCLSDLAAEAELSAAVAGGGAAWWLVAPAERFIATLCHTSSRMLVLLSVVTRRWRFFCCGFLLSIGVDGVAGWLDLSGRVDTMSHWALEIPFVPFAAASVLIIAWCARRWPVEQPRLPLG